MLGIYGGNIATCTRWLGDKLFSIGDRSHDISQFIKNFEREKTIGIGIQKIIKGDAFPWVFAKSMFGN